MHSVRSKARAVSAPSIVTVGTAQFLRASPVPAQLLRGGPGRAAPGGNFSHDLIDKYRLFAERADARAKKDVDPALRFDGSSLAQEVGLG